MKKIIAMAAALFFLFASDGLCIKYRIYKANKPDKVEKYRDKLQKHYKEIHIDGQPYIVACSIPTPAGRIAVPMIGDGCPANDGDDEVKDTLEPVDGGEGE